MLTRLGPEKVILNNAGKTTRKNIKKHFTIESFCHGRGLWMLRFLMLLSCGSLGAMTWPRAKDPVGNPWGPLGTFGGFPKWQKPRNHPFI
jgi:hypothetical protein